MKTIELIKARENRLGKLISALKKAVIGHQRNASVIPFMDVSHRSREIGLFMKKEIRDAERRGAIEVLNEALRQQCRSDNQMAQAEYIEEKLKQLIK